MSTACRSRRSSISRRICSVHGSAPKMPTCSELVRGSMPCRSNSSSNVSMYDGVTMMRSEEHTSELQSRENLVCRLLLEKKKNNKKQGQGLRTQYSLQRS